MPEKILVVDDNMETRKMVSLVLRRSGYTVLDAEDGKEALAIAQKELPDLILLDIMMPDMDGLEVTRRLRAHAPTAHVPIIIFTAKAGLDDELKGFEAGADDYLTKLASPPELIARIRAVLARASKTLRGRMLAVLGARGGLGATTVALNLGVAVHQMAREEVIVAECRPGQGTIGLTLGYEQPQGLNKLLQSNPASLNAATVEAELLRHSSGIRLLPASYRPTDARYLMMTSAFKAVVTPLPQLARYTFLDLGPSLPPAALELLKLCDEMVILVDPVPLTITKTKALVEDMRAEGVRMNRIYFVLVNRGGSSLQLSWHQVEEQLGETLATVITPAAEMAFQAAQHRRPMITLQPESTTAQQFNQLAATVLGRAK